MDMAKQGENDTRQLSCGRRLLRGCGFLVLALLLILVALYVGEISRCSHYAPSGDALYDRYAQAVVQRQAWKLFRNSGTHPATLPDELLAGWEDDFGADPRYWQLRYWCARHRFDDYGTFSRHHPWDSTQEPSQQAAEQYLAQARELGVADADTLWFLLQEERIDSRHGWSDLERDVETLPADERRAKLAEQMRLEEERELELLNAMVAAGPDEAWPYYWRAKYWFNLGEQELAQADLKAGNQAADNHIPRLFPVSAVMQQQLADDARYGNQCVAGAVLEVNAYSAVTNWVKWLETGKEVQLALALGGDLSLAADFHRFACRIGQAEMASPLESNIGQSLIGPQASYILSELSEGMTSSQRHVLCQVYGWALSINSSIMETDSQVPIQQPYPLGVLSIRPQPTVIARIFFVDTGSDLTNIALKWSALCDFLIPTHLYSYYCWLGQLQLESVAKARQSFAALEQVDYEDLEAAAGLLPE